MAEDFGDKVSLIWSVADLLRGDYRPAEYGRVVLPFTVLRRLDQALVGNREPVWQQAELLGLDETDEVSADDHPFLAAAAGSSVYNISRLHWAKLIDEKDSHKLLRAYLRGFSPEVRDIFTHFRFDAQIDRLRKAKLLLPLLKKFAKTDLHPDRVSNHQMGTIFEELIRKFSEQSNETAGEHFTPREVIRLMVEVLFADDREALKATSKAERRIYDPACGTGGMLSVAQEAMEGINQKVALEAFGQEINGESYAICKADLLLKGQPAQNIKLGNTFRVDHLASERFDYLISNPPFGVDWSKARGEVVAEHKLGTAGRFAPGLPRKNDGSLLFLLHMLAKMRPTAPGWTELEASKQGGSRIAIVLNGSPLFTGAAGSGESEIRRHVLENDLLEAIIGLPDQMFYNTGINTYIWVLTNRKPPERRGKVQLINGVKRFRKMRKSLGDKRKELGPDDIAHLRSLYERFEVVEGESLIFDKRAFGFRRITVERPLRLRFEITDDGLARLEEERGFKQLAESKKKKDEAKIAAEIAEGKALQATLRAVLEDMRGTVWMDRETFRTALEEAAKARGLKLAAPLRKAIESAFGERDVEAAICLKKGEPEPDSDLRDYENVPLDEVIDAYMAREVLPHVPDAWVDHEREKIGYEIPFTRHFYVYEPPRPLEVIEGEICELEGEIQGLLAKVLA